MSTQSGRTRMGNYEMGRTLDLGSISKVKFARNMETGEGVAIKVLDKEKVLQHNMVDQIKREISAMKFISHPNVIQLHEVMASKTKIYLVLEFAAGGQLFDKLIGHGKLREDEARRYFQQLINAVDYCHSCGVYHRNLKPENLLLDAYGNLKVSGFGLSALPQQVRKDGLLHTTCGTPNYVAPEVINDKGYDGASADLWSCGVILYVMVSGCFPFDESNIINLYRKINKAEFTCPSWLSSSVKELITRILDPNPKTRITIPEILENEWFKKGYEPPDFQEADGVNIDDVAAIFNDSQEHLVPENKEPQPVLKNAFELITMLQGVNLGNLFEKQMVIEQVDHDGNTNEDSDQMQDHLVAQGFDPPFEGEHHEDESYEIMKNESNDMTTAQSLKITKVQVQSLPNVPVDKVQIIAIHLHLHQVSSTYDKETYVIIKVRSVDKDQDWKFKVFFKYQFHKFKEKIQVFVLTLRGRMLGVMSSLNSPSSTRIVHLNLDM